VRHPVAADPAGGVIFAAMTCSLFLSPATTSASPFIMARKPTVATSAGSIFSSVPTLVSHMLARTKNSVSVAPGIRQVTVTPVSLSSLRSAAANESTNAFEPL
jgi:hypothetical protein